MRGKTGGGWVILAALAPAGQAANLLQNPDFDTGAAGWAVSSTGNAGVAYVADDGSPAAGSVDLSGTATVLDVASVQISQCLTAFGPPPWVFGARLRQLAASSFFDITVSAEFLASPNCGPGLGATGTANPGATVPGVQGPYVQYSGSVAADPMPGGGPTQSVLVRVLLSSDISGTTTFRLDQVYFGPPGTTPVGLSGFEVE